MRFSDSKQPKKTGNYAHRWQSLLYGENTTEVDVPRSINAGASVLSILQYFTGNNQRLSLSEYTSIMNLISDQTPFQVDAVRRVLNSVLIQVKKVLEQK